MIYHGDAMEYIGETPDILSRIIEDQASVLQDCGKIFDRNGISIAANVHFLLFVSL